MNLRRWSIALRGLLQLSCALWLTLFSLAQAADVIELRANQDSYVPGRQVRYLEDPAGTLTLQQILDNSANLSFKQVSSDTANFGFTASTYWFHLDVSNRDSPIEEWFFESQFPTLDQVDAYFVYPDKHLIANHGGDTLPFSQRAVKHRNVMFKMPLPQGQKISIFVRVKTAGPLVFSTALWSRQSLLAKDHEEQLALGIYYGIIVAMLCYNLLIYFSIRDISYLYYVLYIFGITMFQMSYNGLAFEYLWPEYPWWGNLATLFFICIASIGALQFVRSFLGLKDNLPKFDALFRSCLWFYCAMTFGLFFMPYALASKLINFVALVGAIGMIVAGVASMRLRVQHARYFLLAWSVLILSVLVALLKNFSILPHVFVTAYAIQIGTTFEVVLLSFALAHRMRVLIEENTERRRVEQELTRTRDAAEAATLAKSVFLANMSHEIRTPMNAVIGMSHLVLKSELTAPQRDAIQKIQQSGQHLLGIINDILDFSKIEAGMLSVERTPFQLGHLLDNVANLVAEKIRAKGLSLAFDIDKKVPQALIGDPLRLCQIIVNYANNAVKFTERGTIELIVRPQQESDGQSLLYIAVKDSGIGLSAEQCGRLFQSFQQADASTTRKYGGTGLGLAISKRLAELMGGKVGVDSVLGKGSVFWLIVPLHAADEGTIATPIHPSASVLEAQLAGIHGARVLLVEDNEINQDVAAGLLHHAGCKTDIAGNGAIALQMLRQVDAAHYDLVLMDMQMPEMDGVSATRAIRALPQFTRLPIIAMTANAMQADRERCIEAGMSDYVAKPIEPDELWKALLKWIAPRHAPTPKARQPAANAALPAQIAGLDQAAGLQRVLGKTDLYLSMLRKFAAGQKAVPQSVQEALDGGDWTGAERHAHTLHGLAGNIGADRLQCMAQELEHGIRDRIARERIEQLLTTLEPELRTLIEELETKLPNALPDARIAADVEDLETACGELAALLADDDAEASDVFARHAALFRIAFKAEFQSIKDAIDDYDFAQALGSLQDAMHNRRTNPAQEPQ